MSGVWLILSVWAVMGAVALLNWWLMNHAA